MLPLTAMVLPPSDIDAVLTTVLDVIDNEGEEIYADVELISVLAPLITRLWLPLDPNVVFPYKAIVFTLATTEVEFIVVLEVTLKVGDTTYVTAVLI